MVSTRPPSSLPSQLIRLHPALDLSQFSSDAVESLYFHAHNLPFQHKRTTLHESQSEFSPLPGAQDGFEARLQPGLDLFCRSYIATSQEITNAFFSSHDTPNIVPVF